jgi:hypothetical protein
MIFSSKDNLEKSNIKLFSIFILVIHLNSCSSIFSMLEDNGDQNSTLKTIEEKCVNVETSAIAMEKKNIQDRNAKGLSEIARALEACRTEIESSLQPFYNSSMELKTKVNEPDQAKIKLDGNEKSLKEVYLGVLSYEKRLLSLPLDVCMERLGNLSSKGSGGNWEPYVVSTTDWQGSDCVLTKDDAFIPDSIPADVKSKIQSSCTGALIGVTEPKLEALSVNTAKRWSTLRCQKPKERKTGASFLKIPKVDERCETCKRWVNSP